MFEFNWHLEINEGVHSKTRDPLFNKINTFAQKVMTGMKVKSKLKKLKKFET